MMVGDRKRHRHLTIGLLAEFSARLMGRADRLSALVSRKVLGAVLKDAAFRR
jgi:hypothetical protein